MAEELKAEIILAPQQAEGEVLESNRDQSSNASADGTKSEKEIAEKELATWKQRQAVIVDWTG